VKKEFKSAKSDYKAHKTDANKKYITLPIPLAVSLCLSLYLSLTDSVCVVSSCMLIAIATGHVYTTLSLLPSVGRQRVIIDDVVVSLDVTT